jgi:hypothetical protein
MGQLLKDWWCDASNSMRLFRLVKGDLSLSQIDAVGLRREAKLQLAC